MIANIGQLADRSAHALVTEAPANTPDSIWQECFRILHPGAHALVLVYGPTPSYVSVGLRRAGFEFRDTIMVETGVPCMSWQPCLIFRKPVEERTVAHQVLETGTGGLNINSCRVKHANKEDLESHKAMVSALKSKGGSLGNSWKNTSDLSNANEVSLAGRWPGNLLLIHAEGCRHVGKIKAKAPIINRFDDGMKPFGNGAGHTFTSTPTGDENGEEDVAIYECVKECPVKALNSTTSDVDAGGASRFFSQFEAVPELIGWLKTLGLHPEGVLLDPFPKSRST